MRTREPLHITVPIELSLWLREQAKSRRMTISDVAGDLFIRGIQAEAIESTVARITAAADSATMREVLRQTLALRFVLEGHVKGTLRIPETLGTDALQWADSEISKLIPRGERDEY